METGSRPVVPIYANDFRRLVNDAFAGPAPVPVAISPGSIVEQAERFAVWAESVSMGDARPDALFCDLPGCAAPGEDAHGPLRLLPAVEFFPLSLPHRCLINAVLLDLAEDASLGRAERADIEDAVIAEYARHEHLLLPPSVLVPIWSAARGPLGSDFLDFLEEARAAVLARSASLADAGTAHVRYRVEALRRGADAAMTEGQVTVAEAVIDLMLLERACLEDVRRAEAVRGTRPRFEVMKQFDDDSDFAFERALPAVVRPAAIFDAIPPAARERVVKFASGRTVPGPDGFLAVGWIPPQGAGGSAGAADAAPMHGPELSLLPPAPPSAPEDGEASRSLFSDIREQIASRVIGHNDVVDRLALAVLMHQRGVVNQRVLLCGRPGSGKTHLARVIAELSGSPFYLCDTSAIVETGYRGMVMDDMLTAACDAVGGLRALEKAVLVLDEIDKLRCPPDLDGVSRDKRLGQQYALLTLLGGGTPVPIRSGELQVRSEGMLIIAAGAFSDAEWSGVREPTTAELVAYGLLEELAERLTDRIVLRPRSTDEYVRLFRTSAEGVGSMYEVFRAAGYHLEIAEQTLSFVGRALASDRPLIGPRSANAALVQAARSILIRALRSGAPAGSRFTLSPDDVVLPMPARRV